ncbi:CopG family transcriptional regulator [bacterium]|nr:CopG family transcriptional regulator [bacterium]
MNKNLHIRIDEKTEETLNKLHEELHISKSDIIRMAIAKFNNYVTKVNK